jgi:hypothetical protein
MSEKLTSENLERIVEFVIKYGAFEIGCAYAISHLFEEDLKSIKKSHSTINSIKSEIEKAEETYNYNRAAILKYGTLEKLNETIETWKNELKVKFLDYLKEREVIPANAELWIVNTETGNKIKKILDTDSTHLDGKELEEKNHESINKIKNFKIQVCFDDSCAENIVINLARIPRIGEILTFNKKPVTSRGIKYESKLFLVMSVNHWVDDVENS